MAQIAAARHGNIIELGRTTMTVQDVLRLGRGSVVQLERLVN